MLFINLVHLFHLFFFFFNDTATTEIYTLSLHDALPISTRRCGRSRTGCPDRASHGLLGRKDQPSRSPIVPGLAPGVSKARRCCRGSTVPSRELSRMRLGRIGYINCYPVYGAIDRGVTPLAAELVTGTPSELNDLLAAGELDLSVVSAVEYARNARDYVLLPDLAISW